MHAGPATRRNNNRRQLMFESRFEKTRDFFTNNGAHAPTHESKLECSEHRWCIQNLSAARHDRIQLPSAFSSSDQTIDVGLGIGEFERVARLEIGIHLFKT